MAKISKRLKDDAGAALVEYALIIAGVAIIGALAVTVFGDRVSSMFSSTAAVLPGSRNNAPVSSGAPGTASTVKLYETVTEQEPAPAQPDLTERGGADGSLTSLVVETKNK